MDECLRTESPMEYIERALIRYGFAYVNDFVYSPDPPLVKIGMTLAHIRDCAAIITVQNQLFNQGWFKLICHIYGEAIPQALPEKILTQIPLNGKFLTNSPNGSYTIRFEANCRSEDERKGKIRQIVKELAIFRNENLSIFRRGRFNFPVSVILVPSMSKEQAALKKNGVEAAIFSDAWLIKQLPDKLPSAQVAEATRLAKWRGWLFEQGGPIFKTAARE